MFPHTTVLSLIEQLELSGERAWIGDASPQDHAFSQCDLHRLAGFRPSIEHFGRYESVWVVQDVLALQGWRILLDSCIRMLAANGTLVVRYLQNQHISIPSLKSFLFRKYGIRVSVRAELINAGEFVTAFQIKKDVITRAKDQSWTFGILTQGKKVDMVEQFCRSVREYGGLSHEILIVGPRNAAYDSYHPTYIDHAYSASLADICVKKNDIVELARHENVCVLHDRYVLSKDFFSGFDTYGYDFDFLTIRQHHVSGKIYPSYCAMDDGGDLIWGPIYECGNENETWSRHYLNGGLVIAKRALLRAIPFNALIFHNQAEDVELAKVLASHSVLPRINRLSSAVTDVADQLTEAFAFAEHPWEQVQAAQVMPVPEQVPPVASAPILVADANAVPWRRLKAIERRVRNLRRDGHSWMGVAGSATRFVRRKLRVKMRQAVPAASQDALSTAVNVSPIRSQPADKEGCNFILYCGDSGGGVLNVTVHYMRRLLREGIPFCVVPIDQSLNNSVLPADLAAYVVAAPVYPRNLWCIGFPFISHHFDLFPAWVENRWNINFTHWELPYIPRRLAGNFERLDGLMTTTEFVRDALACCTTLPVQVVDPEVRIDPATLATFDRQYFGLPGDKKLFLLNWEFTSSTIRKNPAAGMRAFEEAFAGIEDQVGLVMHVKLAAGKDSATRDEYARFLGQIRAQHPGVILIDRESFSYAEALGLKNACDCYVSLHRSEGYGMGCAEALALGRYCLMTGWSGNLELLKTKEWTERIATVAVALIPVTPADYPWVEEQDEVFQLWADPRPADAVNKMRQIYQLMNHKERDGSSVL
ncbi:hypothetical protein [Massilia sp. PWRC2]|uniref:hypothetical protein n=1 Tax=Massilia sp. PWRC2 TaxID=2804626 RepID=UPI003CF9759E